jgi:hypothetical protein
MRLILDSQRVFRGGYQGFEPAGVWACRESLANENLVLFCVII